MPLLVLAGVNMASFELTAQALGERLGPERAAPAAGKGRRCCSLAIWIGVIFLGRWVAFAPSGSTARPAEEVDFEKLEKLFKKVGAGRFVVRYDCIGPSVGISPPPNCFVPGTESQCLPGSGFVPFGALEQPRRRRGRRRACRRGADACPC